MGLLRRRVERVRGDHPVGASWDFVGLIIEIVVDGGRMNFALEEGSEAGTETQCRDGVGWLKTCLYRRPEVDAREGWQVNLIMD